MIIFVSTTFIRQRKVNKYNIKRSTFHILHIITVPPRQITQVHIIAESPQSRSGINLTHTTSFVLQEQGFTLVYTHCERSRN
jgi:hypothetical protein